MPKKKTLLMIFPLSPIAEEFRGLLSAEYEILITDDEKDGLQILNRMREKISAVLFDLDIAQDNGRSFFRRSTKTRFMWRFRSSGLCRACRRRTILPVSTWASPTSSGRPATGNCY
ncbi:MAG: hypothetical protein IJR38_06025 [Selenomonadaceae bacterium]|nr:hypothetical protein [Selenomonadaceae bacterium]